MFKWFKSSTLDPLNVSMAGAKLGDRLIVVGCSDPQLIAALAGKTGLTGRAVAVDGSSQRVAEAGRISLAEGSTDANLPMSMHIPAITIDGGGRGENAHALNESFDTTDSWQGTQRALLLAVALAQP